MSLSRKDHFIIAAIQLVKPPVEYVEKQETADSEKKFLQRVEYLAKILMKIGEEPK